MFSTHVPAVGNELRVMTCKECGKAFDPDAEDPECQYYLHPYDYDPARGPSRSVCLFCWLVGDTPTPSAE